MLTKAETPEVVIAKLNALKITEVAQMAALASKEDDLNEFFAMLPVERFPTTWLETDIVQDSTPEQVLAIKVAVRQVWGECKNAVERFLTERLETE